MGRHRKVPQQPLGRLRRWLRWSYEIAVKVPVALYYTARFIKEQPLC
ncbi:hypothetical protein ACTMTU_34715 [Streptomyces sp. OZ13]